MIYFGITLRSRAASKNWEMVQRVFNRTLASVWRQTCPEFKVLVACHERPLLWAAYDERLEFLQADTPAPRDHQEMMLDKGWKLSLIAQRVRQLGGGYVMMVDADDLISNRVAAYAAEHPAENGFLSRNGYVYTEGAGYAQQIREPHRICGSCSIVYYRVEDLPDHMPENLWDDTLKDRWIIRKSHRIIPESMKQAGRELAVLPFHHLCAEHRGQPLDAGWQRPGMETEAGTGPAAQDPAAEAGSGILPENTGCTACSA